MTIAGYTITISYDEATGTYDIIATDDNNNLIDTAWADTRYEAEETMQEMFDNLLG
jgi:hypothetical protein